MGLESLTPTTFISGLTQSWPTASEQKSQGDDHLRLIKGALQNTFPNATKPFLFPSGMAITGNTSLTTASNNSTVYCNTSAGAFTISLPALASGDSGFVVTVMKNTPDGNFVNVVPQSGTIGSQAGATPLIRVGQVCQAATFMWSGSAWYCSKAGGMIGEVITFDGGVPPGWLECFGQAIDGAAFCELVALIGTATLRQRAGRVDACWDPGYGVLRNVIGTGIGNAAGTEIHYLTAAQVPDHAHHIDFTSQNDSPDHSHNYGTPSNPGSTTGGGGFQIPGGATTGTTGGANQRHAHRIFGDTGGAGFGSSWHPNMQPTLISRKLIRAC